MDTTTSSLGGETTITFGQATLSFNGDDSHAEDERHEPGAVLSSPTIVSEDPGDLLNGFTLRVISAPSLVLAADDGRIFVLDGRGMRYVKRAQYSNYLTRREDGRGA